MGVDRLMMNLFDSPRSIRVKYTVYRGDQDVGLCFFLGSVHQFFRLTMIEDRFVEHHYLDGVSFRLDRWKQRFSLYIVMNRKYSGTTTLWGSITTHYQSNSKYSKCLEL